MSWISRFHIDPSRSAEAAQKLFGDALLDTVIVCDRYSAYKRLARLREGKVTLAFCWSHMRRDFVDCAAGQVRLADWCQGWIERIASLYRLNEARLAHYDPGIERQAPAFDAAHGALKEALDGLFAEAARELAGLPDEAREGTREGKLWNEFVARYHYLGYKTLVGAQMRYAVHDRDGWPVAMLGFSTAAWKLAPRDTFIGWTRHLREKNLPLVVDNPPLSATGFSPETDIS